MGMECLTMIMEFAHYGYGIDKDTEICQGAIQESAKDSNFILPDVCKDDDDNTWNLHTTGMVLIKTRKFAREPYKRAPKTRILFSPMCVRMMMIIHGICIA